MCCFNFTQVSILWNSTKLNCIKQAEDNLCQRERNEVADALIYLAQKYPEFSMWLFVYFKFMINKI